jgi:hypothetical protein
LFFNCQIIRCELLSKVDIYDIRNNRICVSWYMSEFHRSVWVEIPLSATPYVGVHVEADVFPVSVVHFGIECVQPFAIWSCLG